jgi:predicted ATPase
VLDEAMEKNRRLQSWNYYLERSEGMAAVRNSSSSRKAPVLHNSAPNMHSTHHVSMDAQNFSNPSKAYSNHQMKGFI